jgi:hypothetical protein
MKRYRQRPAAGRRAVITADFAPSSAGQPLQDDPMCHRADCMFIHHRAQAEPPLLAPFYEGFCQGHGPGAVEGAAALVGVNVVRPDERR